MHTGPRWEHGSNFCLPVFTENREALVFPAGAVLFGSGRVALNELLEFGFHSRGWRRLWVPSYYCEDVVNCLRDSRLEIVRYPYGPLIEGPLPTANDGDVLLRCNFFGWGIRLLSGHWGGAIIEDRTHDPFGRGDSSADFVMASLRKTLPLPDGGMVWSPRSHPLPKPPAAALPHEQAVLQRLAAMALKHEYLLGGNAGKETYRELEVASEEAFLRGVSAPMSNISRVMLQNLPLSDARAARGMNFVAFREAMAGDPLLTVLGPAHQEAPAVAVVSVNETELRDELRARLAEEQIYTAVLWPVPETGAPWHTKEDAEFAASTLAVHVDSRYAPSDLQRVAQRMRSLAKDLIGAAE